MQTLAFDPNHWRVWDRGMPTLPEICSTGKQGQRREGFISRQVWRDLCLWEGETKGASAQGDLTSFHPAGEADKLLLELENGSDRMTE